MLLQGDPSLSGSLISLKAMWKAIREQGEGLLVELGCIGVTEEENGNMVPPIIQKVLDHYTHVFEQPMGLTPRRFHDHTIALQPTQPQSMSDHIATHRCKKKRSKRWFRTCWLRG